MAIKGLNAVNKMMVGPSESLYSNGTKPPKGAVMNSYGIERLGESNPRDWQDKNKGVERK